LSAFYFHRDFPFLFFLFSTPRGWTNLFWKEVYSLVIFSPMIATPV
jgi:hypothetical protein